MLRRNLLLEGTGFAKGSKWGARIMSHSSKECWSAYTRREGEARQLWSSRHFRLDRERRQWISLRVHFLDSEVFHAQIIDPKLIYVSIVQLRPGGGQLQVLTFSHHLVRLTAKSEFNRRSTSQRSSLSHSSIWFISTLIMEDEAADIELLEQHLIKTTNISQRMTSILTNFDSRLIRLEKSILPLHKSTQSLTKLAESEPNNS